MTRALALVLLALSVLAPACRRQASGLPPGRYSGSTAEDRAITIDVEPGRVLVNRTRTTLLSPDVNSRFRASRLPGKPVFSCRAVAGGSELRCRVTAGGRTETIELMRE